MSSCVPCPRASRASAPRRTERQCGHASVKCTQFLTSGRDPATAGSSWKGQCSDGSCRRPLRGLRSDHPVSSHPTIGSGRVAMESRSRCCGLDQPMQLGYHDAPLACTGSAHPRSRYEGSRPGQTARPTNVTRQTAATSPGALRSGRSGSSKAPGTTRTRSAPPSSPPVVTSLLAEHVRA